MPVADLADRRHEAGMRRDHPAGAENRLHDEGGDGAGALKVDFIHKRGDTFGGQRLGVGFAERVAIGVRRRNVETAGQKRFVLGAEIGVAVDARPAEMRAVIALFQAEELGARRLAIDLVVLAGKTQRGFDRIRPARGEEGTRHAVGGKEINRLMRQLDHLVVRHTAEDIGIGKLGKLLGDGLFHRFAGISQIDVPQPANRIHRLMPVNVGDPHALSRSQDHRQVCLAVGGMRHRMPDLARVHLAQEIIVKTLASGHAALPRTANGS